MRKRYKKLLACLTMILSMSMTLSPIMSFAETTDNSNGENKNKCSIFEMICSIMIAFKFSYQLF